MSYVFSVNNIPSTPADGFYRIKEFFKANGYSITSSGDGLSAYSSSTDILTNINAGANGTGNNLAWFRAALPTQNSVVREWVWQHSATGSYRVKAAYSGGFTAGSPSATRVPSNTNEKVQIGSGTDASPSFVSWSPGTNAGSRLHMMVDTAAPYGGYIAYVNAGTPSITNFGWWAFDPLASDSVDPTDTDPYVYMLTTNGPTIPNGLGNDTSGVASSWFRKGLSGEGYQPLGALSYVVLSGSFAAVAPTPTFAQMYPISVKAAGFPLFWGRRASQTSPNGPRGRSSMFKVTSTLITPGFTALSNSTSNDWALFGDLLVPWNGTRILY